MVEQSTSIETSGDVGENEVDADSTKLPLNEPTDLDALDAYLTYVWGPENDC